MLQPLFLDDGAVDEGSIAAVQVPHLELSVLGPQASNASRNGRVDDRDAVRRVSPDGNFALGKRNGGIFQRARKARGVWDASLLTSCPFLSHF